MTELDVSVVIPTCDRPQLLRQTLDSVLTQTCPPAEVVVVDNGTADGAETVARSLGSRVRYVRTPPAGVQAARNAGIRAARCTWVALLDDDDLYRPDFLERAAPALQDGRADLVIGDHRKFVGASPTGRVSTLTNAERAPTGYWDGIAGPGSGVEWTYVGAFPVERLLRYNVFYPSTMIVQRSLVQRVGGYDPAMRGIKTEDMELMTRLLPAARVAFAWRALVDYRLHEANNGGDLVAQYVGRWRVLERVREKAEHRSPRLAAALEADLPGRRRTVVRTAFRHGHLDVLREVDAHMSPGEHTAVTRTLLAVAGLPRPVARCAVRLSNLVQPAAHRERSALPQWTEAVPEQSVGERGPLPARPRDALAGGAVLNT